MAKQPASLSSLVRRAQNSEVEPADKPKQRAPRKITEPEPEQELDLGPPRRLSFSCPPRVYLDLQIHKAHTGVPHQEIVAAALEEYLEKHAAKRKR